jgi:hypothetical protein
MTIFHGQGEKYKPGSRVILPDLRDCFEKPSDPSKTFPTRTNGAKPNMAKHGISQLPVNLTCVRVSEIPKTQQSTTESHSVRLVIENSVPIHVPYLIDFSPMNIPKFVFGRKVSKIVFIF